MERPQPGVRPPFTEPRPRPAVRNEPPPSLRPFSLHVGVLAVVTAVGVTAVSLALGRWLSSLVGASGAPPLGQLLLGTLLAFPVTILPYAGWAAAALLASFGMGAILLTRMGSDRPWSLDALQE